jgi:hypothetical protein
MFCRRIAGQGPFWRQQKKQTFSLGFERRRDLKSLSLSYLFVNTINMEAKTSVKDSVVEVEGYTPVSLSENNPGKTKWEINRTPMPKQKTLEISSSDESLQKELFSVDSEKSIEKENGDNQEKNPTTSVSKNIEEVLNSFAQHGAVITKHGRRGKPHPRVVWIDSVNEFVRWKVES